MNWRRRLHRCRLFFAALSLTTRLGTWQTESPAHFRRRDSAFLLQTLACAGNHFYELRVRAQAEGLEVELVHPDHRRDGFATARNDHHLATGVLRVFPQLSSRLGNVDCLHSFTFPIRGSPGSKEGPSALRRVRFSGRVSQTWRDASAEADPTWLRREIEHNVESLKSHIAPPPSSANAAAAARR
jgi:hypothetical protein